MNTKRFTIAQAMMLGAILALVLFVIYQPGLFIGLTILVIGVVGLARFNSTFAYYLRETCRFCAKHIVLAAVVVDGMIQSVQLARVDQYYKRSNPSFRKSNSNL